jgi:hypothetical protein
MLSSLLTEGNARDSTALGGSIVHQRIVAHNHVIEDAFSMLPTSTLKIPPAMRNLLEYSCRPPLNYRCSVAARTGDLAGFAGQETPDPHLLEWDYGHYEGRASVAIHRERPEWKLFRDGCPGGESVLQVTERVYRVVSRLRTLKGDVLIFSIPQRRTT